ncbi:hypothetical protein THRCLA_11143 [Thraustotheca clavata]|uniref:peptidylprolyl isomerase n=1 Tax=Thraustotheca clavata TaxID=74557 RepID=A0A1V9Y8N6_9STRA|nr:hypothetical protein THRCLA_11143 [Thraustotheca clavata]
MEDAAVIKIQRVYRAHLARSRLHVLLKSVIKRYYDEDSGMYYYYNSITNTSTWVKPKLLGNEEVDDGNLLQTHLDDNEDIVQESIDPVDIVEKKLDVVESNQEDAEAVEAPKVDHDEELAVNDKVPSQVEAMEDNEERLKSQLKNTTAINPFSTEELSMIEEQFRKFDTDGSGSISMNELLTMLQSFGEVVTMQDVEKLVKEVDENSDGQVNLSEFIAILQNQREQNAYCPSIELAIMFGPQEIANLRKQFQLLDTDGSGEIDEQELAALMKNLGQDPRAIDIKAVIKEVDRDGNGMINFNEFCHIVYNMRSQSKTKFAALLTMGVAKGLLNDLGSVLASTKNKVSMWWNANRIAEEKRLQAKRERERERERLRLEAEAREKQYYEDELNRLEALEKERLTMVEGLRHEVLLEGDKENYPNRGQYARVHYVGMFENGKVFESSRTRGGALEFKVGCGHVIEGWDVALLRMSVGETAKITCAPKLAYGVKEGRPPKIPGNATLVFTIELIAIKEKVQQDGDSDSDVD